MIRLVFLAVLGLLAGCASAPQTESLLSDDQFAVPRQVELIETPFFPQSDYQCGPAALATVLAARGESVFPDDLVDEVYVPERQGSFQTEMKAAARSRGYLAMIWPKTMRDLLSVVSAQRQVLVLQNLGVKSYPIWHYAVVVGYDLSVGNIVLRSGTQKRFVMRLSVFEKTWRAAGFWAMLPVSPDEPPTDLPKLEYLKAVNELEQLGQWSESGQAYQQAVQHWPDWSLGWFALGNFEYLRENYSMAVSAYQRAVELQSEKASVWNNLAFAMAKQGCESEAIQVAQCADRLKPALLAEQEIKRMDIKKAASCEAVPLCPVQ